MERLRNDACLDPTTAVVVATRSEAVARGAHAVLRLWPDGRPGAPPPWTDTWTGSDEWAEQEGVGDAGVGGGEGGDFDAGSPHSEDAYAPNDNAGAAGAGAGADGGGGGATVDTGAGLVGGQPSWAPASPQA